MIQDAGKVFLSCDSANEPEHHRLSIPIARGLLIGLRKPPNLDKRRRVPQLLRQDTAETLFGPVGMRDEKAAVPENHSVPPACEVGFQSGRDQGW